MPETQTLRELENLPGAYADWRRSTLGRTTDALEERLLLTRIGPARGLAILDVGCGDGVLATRLAAAGAEVTGLDVSPGMIDAARRRAHAAGVALTLVQGDAAHLPFGDAQFDCVVSVATLCFSAEPLGQVFEMVRVLKPEGRLILGDLASGNAWALQRRLKGWLGSPVWRAARFRSREELLALAGAAGLRDAGVTGAIFYPPIGTIARLMAPIDAWLGRRTTVCAAFLVLCATKPGMARASREPS